MANDGVARPCACPVCGNKWKPNAGDSVERLVITSGNPIASTKFLWKCNQLFQQNCGLEGIKSGIHADGALKDRRNYELYDFEELGRGEPEIIDTGRQITAGEYSGIKGFRNVYDKLEIAFKDDAEAARVLELVRYANVHNQKPLVEDELRFVAAYPDIAQRIFTMFPKQAP